ncbi:breast cancer anti-estrogen resistance protein 1 isoform X1 [Drosophila guanche]|uniref:Breast cancer anti-estrogen resistance protein 1 n=2 Tax=Drosophila guanche TaxID=7266 RepID=A0A3B0K9I7_DROGU|nr:breast cancer anti-estrogen resistance protein 1 isoform X1 [Drosophila guanche]SPP84790.1 blast:Breast cancer anti-estrogen resistance protein 1 [Drosophila guanche]
MSTTQHQQQQEQQLQQQQPPQLVEPPSMESMECQSENRVPENSIRNVAKAQTLTTAMAAATTATSEALPKPQTPSVLAKQQHQQQQKLQQQQQQQTQYVINSVAMHAKATTAGVITGGTLHRVKSAQKLYAKAIYDNYADSPDELPFKKGDILTVIEQDTEGIQGWWLCALKNRQGLCPGNRLRILNSYDSGCFSPSPASSPIPSLAASTATLNSSICSAEIYENGSIISAASSSGGGVTNGQGTTNGQESSTATQGRGARRSWHVSPNKVITPQRHGDVYIYNCSPTSLPGAGTGVRTSQQQIYSNQSIYQNLSMMAAAQQQNQNGSGSGSEFETYDIPKPATPVLLNYDSPKGGHPRTPTSISGLGARFESLKSVVASIEEESYDVPRPLISSGLLQQQMTPSSSASSLLTSDSLSLSFSSSNRSSLANMPDYDIPRRNPLPVRRTPLQPSGLTYDFPLPPLQEQEQRLTSAQSSGNSSPAVVKELPLELSSALETLAKLQSQTTSAITRLLSFVVPNWRIRSQLEPAIMELKLAALRLRTALHDLAEFGEGALGNATRSEDRNLALKLRPLVRALRDANKLIHDSSEALDAQGGWSLDVLARSDEKHGCRPPDSLDQLMACAQTLTEDVRSTTSFIQGNASLLFKRLLPAEQNGGSGGIPASSDGCSRGSAEWLEDYDYVAFESKDAAAKKNQSLREAIPVGLKTQFDTVIRTAESTAMGTTGGVSSVPTTPTAATPCKSPEMTDKDKKLVRYYAQQISTHMGNLMQAIDSFLETVEKNQPPKFFIAYGKFVVVSAHNLVTIGDNVHRNISKEALREKILHCTNGLSDALKTCVLKSKKAAAHFPSGSAVQEMVDSVVHINSLARELKTVMLQAVHLSTAAGVGA